jgi:DNA polymerase I-like protein with 3'-5' exonuclease and polymerase domains
MTYKLVATPGDLARALQPIYRGEVGGFAAFDTETNEVLDERFTPWATETRIAGFSISYDWEVNGEPYDFYVPLRHVPYDWRRRMDLLAKVDDGAWVRRLIEDEGVTPEGTWREGWDPNLPADYCFDSLAKTFALGDVEWGAHNWNFDAAMLAAEGIEVPWERIFCTKVASVFTDPRPLDRYDEDEKRYFHGGHSLKHLGEVWLGIKPAEKDLLDEARDVLGAKGGMLNDWSMLPLRTIVGPYAAQDTRLVIELRRHILKRPAYQDEKVRELIRKHNLEIRLANAMERRGVGVNKQAALDAEKESATHVGELLKRANDLSGLALPINNPKQLADTLYSALALPLYRDIRNTRQATLKQVRQRLARDPGGTTKAGLAHDDAISLLDAIMEYRKAEKELTSFYRPLTYFGDTGRVHTILRPLQAKTTRYSASKPNVQQMPRKGDVRTLFIPQEGHVFLLFDYSQQELRVGAHYASAIPESFEWRFTWRCTLAKRGDCKGKKPHGPKDDLDACKKVTHYGYRDMWSRQRGPMGLVDGFMSGDRDFDPHQTMIDTCASRGIEIDRGTAKAGNFSMLYGAGPYKVSEILDCTLDFAKELHKTFWEHAYPELGRVKDFIDERLRRAGPRLTWSHEDFIRTLHGGRIHLDDGYYGLNYVVQRSCREILLNAILDTADYLEANRVPYVQILPVHDELILEAPADQVDESVVRDIAHAMVTAGEASLIPMVVEPGIAEVSWGEKSDLPVSWGYNGVLDGA